MARGQDEMEIKSMIDAGEEGYVVICAGCKGGERNGTRSFTPPC